MARRRLSRRNVRKLFRTGAGQSYGVTLPIQVIRDFGWQENQQVVIDVDEGSHELIIRDWKDDL